MKTDKSPPAIYSLMSHSVPVTSSILCHIYVCCLCSCKSVSYSCLFSFVASTCPLHCGNQNLMLWYDCFCFVRRKASKFEICLPMKIYSFDRYRWSDGPIRMEEINEQPIKCSRWPECLLFNIAVWIVRPWNFNC